VSEQLTRLANSELLAVAVLEGVSEVLGLPESEFVADSELVGDCDSGETRNTKKGKVGSSSEHSGVRLAPGAA
jgi:hypothetical protein